ncbi:MAG TPA: LuxR C-terminal-related transcriptional regulator [Ktedonobacteraceae bacterium]|nr:LuxR C-terminal-related transcriptional regulator [Ktedonobacteraceae bacterium]
MDTQPPDTYELLRTKLAPPRPHLSLVSRGALLERLDEGLKYRLTLLSAPAGFGKTTLLSEWIAVHSEQQNMSPVAWVSLDAGDNDPARFWRYVITACKIFGAEIGESALALLRTARHIPFETVLTMFINDLSGLAHGGILVLEDYHVVAEPQIHEAVTYLIDHLPATLHLLILTRSDPPLPLARLRVHGDLYELYASDLRFSQEETRTFLRQTLPFLLSPETVTRLEARTEGWVAGLRLLTLALQGRKELADIDAMLVSFTGSHRHILEYLVADVLASQPEALQEFLLQTVSLNRLTGSLCDAVTGRNDSVHMLEQLERANLFLISLDNTAQWYRYHALFAEAMQHEARARFGEDYLRSLYDKASHWYEEHGLLAEAVEVALSARDFAHAAMLIERIIGPFHNTSELYTLMRWIQQLPEEVLQLHPALSMCYAIALLFTLDRSNPAIKMSIEKPLERAERCWQAEGNMLKLSEALALRSQIAWWQGNLPQAFAAARKSLAHPFEQDKMWLAASTLTTGIENLLAGKLDAARQAALEAQLLFEAVENPYGTRAAIYLAGETSFQRGDLHMAVQLYQQEFSEAANDPLDMSNALIGLAKLSYEWNDLQRAEQEVAQALELGKQHMNEVGKYHAEQFVYVPGSLVLARVLHARGETVQAQHLLQELVVLTQERKWQYLHREVLAEQARLQLSVGDLASVQRWSTTINWLGEDFRLIQQEQEALIAARLLIAQGKAEEALHLLVHWHAEAQAQRRRKSEIEILLLKAVAHFTRSSSNNDDDISHTHLSQGKQMLIVALSLAQPEGYQRLFLDEGQPMAVALRAIVPDVREESFAIYLHTLLSGFNRQHVEKTISSPSSSTTIVPPFEPLSPQEQRVLRLLAAGRSNPEIAQELVVSINTVKTQVQSIYRKMNVKNRWEARDAARELKIL